MPGKGGVSARRGRQKRNETSVGFYKWLSCPSSAPTPAPAGRPALLLAGIMNSRLLSVALPLR